MAMQDKVNLLQDVEGTLKSRMFANLLEEAITEINGHLDNYDIQRVVMEDSGSDDLLDTFINAKKVEERSEKTLTRYKYIIVRFLMFAGVSTRNVTTYHIRNYFASEQDRGISESTISGIKQVLSSYFGWLTDERLIRTDPTHNVGVIKVPKRVKEAITDSDMERLKRSCTCCRDSAIINFFRSTACRVSEVCSLNRDNLDFSNNSCTVIGKGDKQRIVYYDEITEMVLKEYLLSRTDNNKALFLNKKGTRLQPGGVRNILNRIANAAGVAKVHPHKFRRTQLTTLLNRGMALQEVAVFAGHDRVDTTMKYFSVKQSQIKNSYERFSR